MIDFCKEHPHACQENFIGGINPYTVKQILKIPLNQTEKTGKTEPSVPLFPLGSSIKKGKNEKTEKTEKPFPLTFTKDLKLNLKAASKFVRVANVSNSIPEYLTDYSKLVKGEETADYHLIHGGSESSFNVFEKGPNRDELYIAFKGATGSDQDTKNVFNVIKNKSLEGPSVEAEKNYLDNLFKSGEIENYKSVKFVGHSLGGYKARLYGAKYNVDTELLNAHILPYNSFEPTSAETNFHTIITDPLDFKMLIQPKTATEIEGAVNHTYYQPLTEEGYKSAFGGSTSDSRFVEPHYAESWSNLPRETQNDLTESFKIKYPEMFANTAVAGISIAGSIYQAIHDPNYNPATDPMLGGATETGIVGFNIDPDYSWGSTAPSGGFDWLIWKSLQPIVKATASESNPLQDLATAKRIEVISGTDSSDIKGTTLSSKLYTFNYAGQDYYYQKDDSGNPTWFAESGQVLSQDIKDAYFKTLTPSVVEDDSFIDYNLGGG
jgi:hypothetical protein